jgi:MinD-like ATPase involved in chromosome partitioning or flagellar assembly
VINIKGGVGKTTIAVSLASLLRATLDILAADPQQREVGRVSLSGTHRDGLGSSGRCNRRDRL